jgi:hypothetical protein
LLIAKKMTKSRKELSEMTVQGKLLQSRGDLSGYRINFMVELPKRPLGKPRHHAPARLGLEVTTDDNKDALKVQNVVEHGNWDTPVIHYNEEQKQYHQLLYTVQPGDWLTAVNEKHTGNAMLREIERQSTPTASSDMNLSVQRQLRDIMKLSTPALPGPRKCVQHPRESWAFDGTQSISRRGKFSSTGDLDSLLRRTCSNAWPQRRAVPSGSAMSSLAWGNYHSYGKKSPLGNRLPDIAKRQAQATQELR